MQFVLCLIYSSSAEFIDTRAPRVCIIPVHIFHDNGVELVGVLSIPVEPIILQYILRVSQTFQSLDEERVARNAYRRDQLEGDLAGDLRGNKKRCCKW